MSQPLESTDTENGTKDVQTAQNPTSQGSVLAHVNLLMDLFTPSEFGTFLKSHYTDLVAFIPQVTTPQEFFTDVVCLLHRHGNIDRAFVKSLISERRQRADEITDVFSQDPPVRGSVSVEVILQGTLGELSLERLQKTITALKAVLADESLVVIKISAGSVKYELKSRTLGDLSPEQLATALEKIDSLLRHEGWEPISVKIVKIPLDAPRSERQFLDAVADRIGAILSQARAISKQRTDDPEEDEEQKEVDSDEASPRSFTRGGAARKSDEPI